MSDPYEAIEVKVFGQTVAWLDKNLDVHGPTALWWAYEGMPEEYKTLSDALKESARIRAAAGDIKEFKKAFVLWCKQILKVCKGYASYTGKG